MMMPVKIKLDKDFDINQQNEPHILLLFNIKYQQGESVTDFYNQYRDQVIAGMKKQGDIIAWKDNSILPDGEELSPLLENLILANVLRHIDVRLPRLLRTQYKIGRSQSLMDYKEEIFVRVPVFLNEIEMGLHGDLKTDRSLSTR